MKQVVNQSKKNTKINYIFAILILFIIFTIIINPTKYSEVALSGLEVWFKVLVPSLFPFFVLTKLFSASDLITDFTKLFSKPMQKLYKCPPVSAYIFFMSIVTGYPVGAKLVSDFYNSKNLTQDEAIKTLSFCSNSGPMFILGSVAIGMFCNKALGIVVYISHVLGSLINGLLYRNYRKKECLIDVSNIKYISESTPTFKSQNIDFTDSINSSISSMLLIGGVICFAFVLIEFITSNLVFKVLINFFANIGISQEILSAIFCGIFEITKGCLMLSNIPLTFNLSAILITFIVSFGGVSTMLQAIAFTKNIVPTKFFILQKLSHAVVSCFICFIITLIF